MKLPTFLRKLSARLIERSPFLIRCVQGHSMVPILPPGTYVWGWKPAKKFRVGDVIIFEHDGKEKIKRIQDIQPDGKFFVLGEHRETSTDSRHFGAIDPSSVLAKIIWPSVKPK